MPERRESYEQLSAHLQIDVLTPESIAQMGHDSYLQDALNLLGQGIWELQGSNGMEGVQDWRSNYTLQVPPRLDGQERTSLALWDEVEAQGRKPFMLVGRNSRDGIAGVLEGRIYNNGLEGLNGERSLMTNWVVVKNHGTNDGDESYRGRQISDRLYDQAEELARANGVTLLIAGINKRNPYSARAHERRGYSLEVSSGLKDDDGDLMAHPTERGAFIPSYEIEDVDASGNPVKSEIVFYTKRLR